jgi:uncharacterized protein (TIGR02147 family)
MENSSPSIYNYTDYRLFLRDFYNYRKILDKKFSHRFIAVHVGASSSGWFSDVINGRINLTRTYQISLCKLLHLRQRESDFFEALVDYAQAGSLDEKNRYMQKIISFKEVNPSLIGQKHFEFYSKWYITAIRELLMFYDFKDDYKSLGKMLNPPVRPAEALQAIEILLSFGFIEKDSKGFLRPVTKTITKDTAFRSVHWGNFVTSMMKLAIESVDRHDADIRDISAVTINLSQENFHLAKAHIEELRRRLLALAEQDNSDNTVYQCNIQLFPLSRSNKDSK